MSSFTPQDDSPDQVAASAHGPKCPIRFGATADHVWRVFGRMSPVQRYGLALGRLWMRWPYFEPRDLWVGVYVKERFWELDDLTQRVYVCPIPALVLCFDWTVRRGR